MKQLQCKGSFGRSGFSLAELMVVIVILGLLATLVVSNLIDQLRWAKVNVTEIEIQRLDSTADEYAIRNGGRYPLAIDELRTPDENGVTYADFGPDAWGTEYAYEPPSPSARRPWIASYGEDKLPGGEGFNADIINWELARRGRR